MMRRYTLAVLTGAAIGLATSQMASAADLGPVKRAPPRAPAVYVPPPPPPFSWTGFYIGGNVGAAWTHAEVQDNFTGNSFSNSQQAVFAGGGQVGANYQWNWLVVGVEADFDWLANNHNSTNSFIGSNGHAFQLSFNDRWMTTVAGRVGVAFPTFNNWLWYGKAGGGWVGVNNPTVTDVTTGNSLSISNSNSNSGLLVGAGVEWAFAPNWTAKLEYDKLFLDDRTFTVNGTVLNGDVLTLFHRNVQTVTVGVNYLFNWQ